MSARFDADRMYTYLKGYFMGKGWPDAVNALSYARDLHKGQTRKDGQPYIVHPLSMACHALCIGLDREDVVAACLLHDVVEDCGVKVTDLPVSDEIKDIVDRLTHVKTVPLPVYYDRLSESEPAMLVKLLDRCDNVSTMAGVFSLSKTLDYVQETKDYVLPLVRKVKDGWPTDSDYLFVLKYQITAVIDSISAAIEAAMATNKTNDRVSDDAENYEVQIYKSFLAKLLACGHEAIVEFIDEEFPHGEDVELVKDRIWKAYLAMPREDYFKFLSKLGVLSQRQTPLDPMFDQIREILITKEPGSIPAFVGYPVSMDATDKEIRDMIDEAYDNMSIETFLKWADKYGVAVPGFRSTQKGPATAGIPIHLVRQGKVTVVGYSDETKRIGEVILVGGIDEPLRIVSTSRNIIETRLDRDMNGYTSCDGCRHDVKTDGKVRMRCLACRRSYPGQEAFLHKSDMYEPADEEEEA